MRSSADVDALAGGRASRIALEEVTAAHFTAWYNCTTTMPGLFPGRFFFSLSLIKVFAKSFFFFCSQVFLVLLVLNPK
jgi:hypothetical protein